MPKNGIKEEGTGKMTYEFLNEEKRNGDLFSLYQELGWQQFLKVDARSLRKTMQNSFYVLYVYDEDQLIGTGRVVSDGVINAYICGIGVALSFRNQGIGSEILNRLVATCEAKKLHIQLLCEEELKGYYEKRGFERFAVGMKK